MPPYKIQLIFLIGRTGQDQVAQMITWLGGKDGTNCMSQGWCRFTPLSSQIVAGWWKYFWRSLAPPHGGSSSKSEISLRFPNYLRKVTLLKTNLVWLNCQHWKCTIYILCPVLWDKFDYWSFDLTVEQHELESLVVCKLSVFVFGCSHAAVRSTLASPSALPPKNKLFINH